MRRILHIIVAAAVCIPLAASADDAQLQALLAKVSALQTQLSQLQGRACSAPTQSLARGASGAEVIILQQFLAKDASLYPEGTVSGYYGALTEAAVRRFQAREGIVSSGDAATTGYGAVGPKTLAAIRARACAGENTLSLQPQDALSHLQGSVIPALPVVRFSAPTAETVARPGGGLSIVWQTSDAPASSRVLLSLESENGESLGELAANLPASGTYFWNIPAPPQAGTSAPCTSDAYTCLLEFAAPESTCTGLCSLADGAYKVLARLVYAGSVVSSARSPEFSIRTAQSTISLSFSATSTQSATSSTSASPDTSYSSSVAALLAGLANNAGASNAAPRRCLYSGVEYQEGVTLEVNCADVTAPLASCGSYGGMQLTCRSGAWVDASGAAASVPGVTDAPTGNTCKTPWGNQTVAHGSQVAYQPYFTGGNYTLSVTTPTSLMQCSNGLWLKCDWTGDKCAPFTVIQ